MNYTLIETDELIAYMHFLPEYVQDAIRQKDTCVIGGFDEEGRITCIGVFSYALADKREAELLYLYTREQYQGQGWAAGLLEYAERMLSFAGITMLSCMLTGEIELVSELSEFLKAHSFVPRIVNWHMYCYSYEQVAACPRLVSYKDSTYSFHPEKEEIRRIVSLDTQIPLEIGYVIRKEADVDNSLFYVNNNQLMMAILMGTGQSKYHFVKAIYLNPFMKRKDIMMSMFAHMTQDMPVKDTQQDRICFYSNHDKYGQFCRKMFGEPQKDYWIQRYEKKLLK